jgi:phenylacetaldehyde dehydrogenase
VGKLIVHAAAGNLKEVSLELGGKSPNVILKTPTSKPQFPEPPAPSSSTTASAAAPVPGSMSRKRLRQGGRRHGPARQENQGWVRARTRLANGTACLRGATQSRLRLSRVGILRGSESRGRWPTLAIAGTSSKPTVLVNTNEDMKVVQEEIFGPVVTAMPFTDPRGDHPARQ